MRTRYIIGAVVAIILVVIGYFALETSSIEYADIDRAEKLGKTVQVVGTWVKEDGANYDRQSDVFTFTLEDEHGKRIPVELHGAKPNNFEIAVSLVVKGRIENGKMHASHVLTKCPSKYEGQVEAAKAS